MEESRDAVSPADKPEGEDVRASQACGEGGDSDAAAAASEDATERLARIAESVLFAAGAPVSLRKLVEILDGPSAKDVLAAVARLKEEYGPGQRGIQLHEVAGGYQLRTARENAPWVRSLFKEKPTRLGRAALETLAVVAYKQPVTRTDIESIRGVDVDGVLNTLLARRLIKVTGRKEAVGRPQLYGTTPDFLETFGLKDIDELPSLRELGPEPYADTPDATRAAEETAHPTRAADAFDAAFVDLEAEDLGGAVEGREDDGTFAAGSAPASAAADGEAEDSGGDPAPAEAPESGGGRLEAEGGGSDPRGKGADQRPHGDRAGDEGGPEN